MSRYFALLGLHFVLNFILLPENPVVAHPVHHDDYANFSASLKTFMPLSVRPVSTLAIAALGDLGPSLAYGVMNLLIVACVYLCLRFVELFVRDGKPLPTAGFLAAGAMALGSAAIIDWTKYSGLLTNATSALLGLGALCMIARSNNDGKPARLLYPAIVGVAALSFLAKEDFALPILIAIGCTAVVTGNRRWSTIAIAIGAAFGLVLLFNRRVGSVFVAGTGSPDHPYFMNLSLGSLFDTYFRLLFTGPHAWSIVLLSGLAVVAATIASYRNRARVLKLIALLLIAFSILAPYAIFPNHVFSFYGFVPLSLLAATIAVAAYDAVPKVRASCRIDWAAPMLVGAAMVALWLSYNPRRDVAEWYAGAADYNQSITRFLIEHRAKLQSRTIMVFGVYGQSPWSRAAGSYLRKIIGADNEWLVFVPREDIFYRFGKFPGGTVTVAPDAGACEQPRAVGTVYLAFDPSGQGSFADDCERALDVAHALPTLESWGPTQVSPAQAAVGFNMFFVGANLGADVEISVNGMPLPIVHGEKGRLITTSIPAHKSADDRIFFSVSHRGKNILTGGVVIAAKRVE